MGLRSDRACEGLDCRGGHGQATASIEEATALVKDIRAGRGTVGKLFTDDAVYRDVNALLVSAERVASRSPAVAGRSAG